MQLHRDDGDSDRAAILLPGAGYAATMPLLYYARLTLAELGWTTIAVTWEPPTPGARERWVCDQLEEVKATVDARTTLVVGKSLGSLAAFASATQPAIWLTPLMASIAVPVRESRARALLIGGTADELWDSQSAHRTGKEVLEIDGADHSMEIAGAVERSVETLGRVVAAIDAFARRLG